MQLHFDDSHFIKLDPVIRDIPQETKALLHNGFESERNLYFYLLIVNEIKKSGGTILLTEGEQDLWGFPPCIPLAAKEFDYMLGNLFHLGLINFFERSGEEVLILLDTEAAFTYSELLEKIQKKQLIGTKERREIGR